MSQKDSPENQARCDLWQPYHECGKSLLNPEKILKKQCLQFYHRHLESRILFSPLQSEQRKKSTKKYS